MWIKKGVDQEKEEDFLWLKEMLKPDQACVDLSMYTEEQIKTFDNTYLTFINEMREPMLKGTQAWYCYGNRTNSYLLINYGFCFPNNFYTSFKFYVNTDVPYSAELLVEKLITVGKQTANMH